MSSNRTHFSFDSLTANAPVTAGVGRHRRSHAAIGNNIQSACRIT